MRLQTSLLSLAWWVMSPVNGKQVFAHYMIGTTDASTDHAAQDVQQAMAMGLDGFAMNVGAPGQDFAKSTVQQLFDAASSSGGVFNLFFSFDLVADGSFQDHVNLWTQFSNHSNYLKGGPNNYPVVSSFGGYDDFSSWQSFKQTYDVSLLPNLDSDFGGQGDTSQYYTSPSDYLGEFVSIVDGFFSWESAWPPGSSAPANLSSTGDQAVLQFALQQNKTYMMPLSSLQFKDCCGGDYYRKGDADLALRMEQILDLKPDFAEVITWNDGGESHYIGNLWAEAYNTVPDILQYANTDQFPHYAWQPLITSFIAAFKAEKSASEMAPPSSSPIGTMWYHPTLTSCSGASSISNSGSVVDAINYAIVLPTGSSGFQVKVSSGGNQIALQPLKPGLNYGSVANMVAGAQTVEVVANGESVLSASSLEDVPATSSTCNFNYVAVGLGAPSG